MTEDPGVYDADDVPQHKRKSPSQRLLEDLNGEYKTFSEVAKIARINTETLRRLCKKRDLNGNKLVKAPSKAIRQGQMTIFLFTPEDVQEIENYFDFRSKVVDL